jgi:hypothetical protein
MLRSFQLLEDQRGVTIGEAARQSGLPVETLRYYDLRSGD